MQLESHATPPQETPQQRYATLHRAIERGLDSDEVWRELSEVSLQLGHFDEAVLCMRKVRSTTVQKVLESRLVRRGLIPDPAARRGDPRLHAEAPAASDAGPRASAPAFRLQDHVVDAVQYLFQQHMPWLVLVTTLAFPLVIGLGGFLTAGGSPLLLAAIAALPGLSVLAVVGAMGRQILIASSEGSADVPNVPDFPQLVADARRFLQDAGLVLGALLAPALLALALGAPLATTLPGILTGAFFTPLAWALRQIRGDLGSISPVTLLRGLARGGLGYLGLVPVCWLLFAPAALVAMVVFRRPIWVQIAIIGPLCVLPLFVVSRLIGTWIDSMRNELRSVLVRPAVAATRPAAGAATSPPNASTPEADRPRFPRRPERLEHFTPPNVKRRAAPLAPPRATPTATAPSAAARPRPANRHPTPARTMGATRPPAPPNAPARAPAAAARPRQPEATAPAAPPAPAARCSPEAAPARRAGPAPTAGPAARAIEGRMPRHALTDQPDLSNLPGAVVVSGRDRVRHGAAAKPR